MADLTLHETDPEVLARLMMLASEHGRTLEEEVRVIVRHAVGVTQDMPRTEDRQPLGDWWVKEIRGMGEIPLPSREDPPRALPFSEHS